MRVRNVLCLVAMGLAVGTTGADDTSSDDRKKADKPTSVHEFTVESIDGKQVKLADYAGQVLLIVNVASK